MSLEDTLVMLELDAGGPGSGRHPYGRESVQDDGLNKFTVDSKNWNEAKLFFSSFPQDIFSALQGVRVVNKPPGDSTKYGLGGILASYTVSTDKVNPGIMFLQKDTRTGNIIHELGHAIEDSKLGMLGLNGRQIPPEYSSEVQGMFNEYKSAKSDDDGISDYSLKNIHEWFAEAIKAVVWTGTSSAVDINKSYIKNEFPKTFALVSKVLKGKPSVSAGGPGSGRKGDTPSANYFRDLTRKEKLALNRAKFYPNYVEFHLRGKDATIPLHNLANDNRVQSLLFKSRIQDYQKQSKNTSFEKPLSKNLPLVWKNGNTFAVYDGRHRLASKIANGDKSTKVRLLDVNPGIGASVSAGGPGSGRHPYGSVFVSPNKNTGTKIADALQMLKSPRQQDFVNKASQIVTTLDSGKVKNSVGVWKDGAENSSEIDLKTSEDVQTYIAALLGKMGKQKAVLNWVPDANGPHSLFSITSSSSLKDVSKQLAGAGIEFHTLSSSGGKTNAVVLDTDNSLGQKIGKLSKEQGYDTTRRKGTGTFIGSWTSRKEGAAKYDKIIKSFESKHPDKAYRGDTRLAAGGLCEREGQDNSGWLASEVAAGGPGSGRHKGTITDSGWYTKNGQYIPAMHQMHLEVAEKKGLGKSYYEISDAGHVRLIKYANGKWWGVEGNLETAAGRSTVKEAVNKLPDDIQNLAIEHVSRSFSKYKIFEGPAIKEQASDWLDKGAKKTVGASVQARNAGHEVKLFGLTMRIENAAGTIRRGVDPDGNKWATKMPCDYGKIIGTKGIDGESVDCFIGPNETSKNVYVIHLSKKASDGEDKVMLGFKSRKAAMACFSSAYDDPKKFFGGMSKISMKALHAMLKTHRGKQLSAMQQPFGGFYFDYASFDVAPPRNTTPVSNEGYDEDDELEALIRKSPENIKYYSELARRQGVPTISQSSLMENFPSIYDSSPQMN